MYWITSINLRELPDAFDGEVCEPSDGRLKAHPLVHLALRHRLWGLLGRHAQCH